MRAATFFTIVFLFITALTVLAGKSHVKSLDRRLSCADSIQQAPHECLDFVYGLIKCVKDSIKTVSLCVDDYWTYVSSFDNCVYDFIDCLGPPGRAGAKYPA